MEHTVRCDRYFLLLLLAIGVSSLLSDLSVSSNNPFDSDDGGIMKIVICLSNVMQAGEDGGYCDEVSTAEPLPIAPGAGGGGGRARPGENLAALRELLRAIAASAVYATSTAADCRRGNSNSIQSNESNENSEQATSNESKHIATCMCYDVPTCRYTDRR